MLRIDHREGFEVWLRWSPVCQHFSMFSAIAGEEADYIGCADTMVSVRLFAAAWLTTELL